MSFIKDLKEAVGFQILKYKERDLFALEDASHVIYAAHEYCKNKKSVKGLDSLTTKSKAYYWLFGLNHKTCNCWRCRIRELCLGTFMKQKTNLIALRTSYKVIRMPEKNIYPFFEEWIEKNKQIFI